MLALIGQSGGGRVVGLGVLKWMDAKPHMLERATVVVLPVIDPFVQRAPLMVRPASLDRTERTIIFHSQPV